MSIPVICDRCRAQGFPGEGDFSHLGDLLEFEPVPVKPRVNGWDPEAQRAFIALLATTGSKRRSAIAIGRNAYGIDQLLKRSDSDSFKAAYDRALAIARENGAMKLATGIADAAARQAQLTPPSRLRGLEPVDEPEMSEEASAESKAELLERIAAKLLRKVAQEREARLAGRIVEADFTLRQVTAIEVMIDLAAAGLGEDSGRLLRDLRRRGHGLVEIVDTPFARLLDEARRAYWQSQGDPPRPVHPDPRYAVDRNRGPWGDRGADGYSVALDQSSLGPASPPPPGFSTEEWAAMPVDEQHQARQRQRESDAQAQVEWESRARAEWLAAQSARGTDEHGSEARAEFEVRQSAPPPRSAQPVRGTGEHCSHGAAGKGEGGTRASRREGEGA